MRPLQTPKQKAKAIQALYYAKRPMTESQFNNSFSSKMMKAIRTDELDPSLKWHLYLMCESKIAHQLIEKMETKITQNLPKGSYLELDGNIFRILKVNELGMVRVVRKFTMTKMPLKYKTTMILKLSD